MSSTLIADDRIMAIWDWCSAAYLRQGMLIRFPSNTDPHKTYQWRFATSIAKKFEEWNFDDITAKKFIDIAVSQAKQRGVLKKGLAALHQSNMLQICYQILTSQQKDNIDHLQALENMKMWFDSKIGHKSSLDVLLARRESRALPNIIIWYQAHLITDLFIALSKACTKAVFRLQNNDVDSNLLPSITSLYLLRAEFLSEANNVIYTSQLFGEDFKRS